MGSVNVYGPYWVLNLPENRLQPGEVRAFTFGPWPPFENGTSTVSATVWDFGPTEGWRTRNITVENLEYILDGQERFVSFRYRNSGSEPIQGWQFYLSVTAP